MPKANLHPKYNPITITCAGCKTVYNTRSTSTSNISVEICAACHPYYTGQQRLVDTEGRVDRFNKKYSREAMAQRRAQPKK
ncbi:50S ribosomal protein L31 [Anthocerotibacter panamensis]|uniref:50S ribosomal protein L31 n=1 Tax=Anthocerotibacter panamensis TaxID=2857077 RepID=UPI001C402A91|nr:50S ribosomal protein L31 [Anthocerotibacter panamensis]